MSFKPGRGATNNPVTGENAGLLSAAVIDTDNPAQDPKTSGHIIPGGKVSADQVRAATERLENNVILNNSDVSQQAARHLNPIQRLFTLAPTAGTSAAPQQANQQFALDALLEKPKSKRDPAEDFFAELVLRVGALRANAIRQAMEDVIKDHIEDQSKAEGAGSPQSLGSMVADLAKILERGDILQLYQGQAGTGRSSEEFMERLTAFAEAELSRLVNERSTREIATDALQEVAEANAQVTPPVNIRQEEAEAAAEKLHEVVKSRALISAAWEVFNGVPKEQRDAILKAYEKKYGESLIDAIPLTKLGLVPAIEALIKTGKADVEITQYLTARLESIAETRGRELASMPSERDAEVMRQTEADLKQLKEDFASILRDSPAFAEFVGLHYQRVEDRVRLDVVSERVWRFGLCARETAGVDGRGDYRSVRADLNEYLATQQDLCERYGERLSAAFEKQFTDAWNFSGRAVNTAAHAAAELKESMEGAGTDPEQFDAAIDGLSGYERYWVRRAFNERQGDGYTWRAWVEGDFSGRAESSRIDAMLGVGIQWGAGAKKLKLDDFVSLGNPAEEAAALLTRDREKIDAVDMWNLATTEDALKVTIEVFSGADSERRTEIQEEVQEIYGADLLARLEQLCEPETYEVIKQLISSGEYDPDQLLAALTERCDEFANAHAALIAGEVPPSQEQLERRTAEFSAEMEPFFALHPEMRDVLQEQTTTAILQQRAEIVFATLVTFEKMIGQMEASEREGDEKRLAELIERRDAYLARQKEFIELSPEYKAKLDEARETARKRGIEQMDLAETAAQQIHFQMKGGSFGWTGAAEQDAIVNHLKNVIRNDLKDRKEDDPLNQSGEIMALVEELYRDNHNANIQSHFEDEFESFEYNEIRSLFKGDISAGVAWDLAGIMAAGGDIEDAEKAAAAIKIFAEPETFAPYRDELLARTKEVFDRECVSRLNTYFVEEQIHILGPDEAKLLAPEGTRVWGPPEEAVQVANFDDAVKKLFKAEARMLFRAAVNNDVQLEEAARLFEYLERWNDPEEKICKLLERVVRKEDGTLDTSFEARYASSGGPGQDLRERLRANLSGAELAWALALLDGNWVDSDVHKLRFALGEDGDGTRTSLVTEVFMGHGTAQNQERVERYAELYKYRDLDAELERELEAHEFAVIKSLIETGELSIAQQLVLCFRGDLDGEDWKQKAIQLTAGMNRDELNTLFLEFSKIHPEMTLQECAEYYMSGHTLHDFQENIRGWPDPSDEPRKYQQDICEAIYSRYAHETSGDWATTVGGWRVEYDEKMLRWVTRAKQLEAILRERELNMTEQRELEAIWQNFKGQADLFRAQNDAAANTVATVAAATAAIAVSILIPGSTPVIWCIFITAGVSGTASFIVKSQIKGEGYAREEQYMDAAFAALDGLTIVPCARLGTASAQKIVHAFIARQFKARGLDLASEAVQRELKAAVKSALERGSIKVAFLSGAFEGGASGAGAGMLSGALTADWQNENFFVNLKNIGYQTVGMAAWGGFVGGSVSGTMRAGQKVESAITKRFIGETLDEVDDTLKVRVARAALTGAVGGTTMGIMGGALTADWQHGDLWDNLLYAGLLTGGGMIMGGTGMAGYAALNHASNRVAQKIASKIGLGTAEEIIAERLAKVKEKLAELADAATKGGKLAVEDAADNARLAEHAAALRAYNDSLAALEKQMKAMRDEFKNCTTEEQKAALRQKYKIAQEERFELVRGRNRELMICETIIGRNKFVHDLEDRWWRFAGREALPKVIMGGMLGGFAGFASADWKNDGVGENFLRALAFAGIGSASYGMLAFSGASSRFALAKIQGSERYQALLKKLHFAETETEAAIAATNLKKAMIRDALQFGVGVGGIGLVAGFGSMDKDDSILENFGHVMLFAGGGLVLGTGLGAAAGGLRYTRYRLEKYFGLVDPQIESLADEAANAAAKAETARANGDENGSSNAEGDAAADTGGEQPSGAVADDVTAPAAAAQADDAVPAAGAETEIEALSSPGAAAQREQEAAAAKQHLAELKASGAIDSEKFTELSIEQGLVSFRNKQITEVLEEIKVLQAELAQTNELAARSALEGRITAKSDALNELLESRSKALRLCMDEGEPPPPMLGDGDSTDPPPTPSGDVPGANDSPDVVPDTNGIDYQALAARGDLQPIIEDIDSRIQELKDVIDIIDHGIAYEGENAVLSARRAERLDQLRKLERMRDDLVLGGTVPATGRPSAGREEVIDSVPDSAGGMPAAGGVPDTRAAAGPQVDYERLAAEGRWDEIIEDMDRRISELNREIKILGGKISAEDGDIDKLMALQRRRLSERRELVRERDEIMLSNDSEFREYGDPGDDYSDRVARGDEGGDSEGEWRPGGDSDDDGGGSYDRPGGSGDSGGGGGTAVLEETQTRTETKTDTDVDVEAEPASQKEVEAEPVEAEPETQTKPQEAEVEVKPEAPVEPPPAETETPLPVQQPQPAAAPRVTIIHGPLPPRILPELAPEHSVFSGFRSQPEGSLRPSVRVRQYIQPVPEPTPESVASRTKTKPKPRLETELEGFGRAVYEYRRRRIEEEKLVRKPLLLDTPDALVHTNPMICENAFHTRSPVMQKMRGCCPTCGARGSVA